MLYIGLNWALNGQFLGGRGFFPSPPLGTLICLFFFPALSPVLWLVQLAGGGLLMRTAAFLCARNPGQIATKKPPWRPGAVSVCAGPRKRAQLPPAALRLPVFYLLPPQNSAGFATASILARGFARGGGQIAAFPRPCKSAATAGACCALRLLMRDKHGHHCNASAAGVQPWFVPESTSQLAGPEFDSRLLNLTPSSSI